MATPASNLNSLRIDLNWQGDALDLRAFVEVVCDLCVTAGVGSVARAAQLTYLGMTLPREPSMYNDLGVFKKMCRVLLLVVGGDGDQVNAWVVAQKEKQCLESS